MHGPDGSRGARGIGYGKSRNALDGCAGWAREAGTSSIGAGGEPMQTLRASLVAFPFVVLAVVVAALSGFVGPAQ